MITCTVYVLKLEYSESVGSRKYEFVHLDCLHRLMQSLESAGKFQSSHVQDISLQCNLSVPHQFM